MVAEMMAEDERLLERKRVELASIRARYQSLYHELHPDKVYPDEEHSLAVLAALRIYADQWEQLKEEHEQLLEREVEIRREESRLCHELQEYSLQTENGSLLSKPLVTQISLLSEHIADLRGEKVAPFASRAVLHLRRLLSLDEASRSSLGYSSNANRIRESLRMETTEGRDDHRPIIGTWSW